MIPQWSARAKKAIVTLYQPLQDVDVYVEDDGDEAFYRALLERLVPQDLRIVRVFAGGGRAAVLAKAVNHDFAERRALFLVDGDLPWVRGEPAPAVRGVYQLPCYCIENVLICGKAACEVLAEQEAILVSDAKSRLKFDEWRSSIQSHLCELFMAYAILNEVNPDLPTVAIPLGRMISKGENCTRLDAEKVKTLVNDLTAQARELAGDELLSQRVEQVRERLKALDDQLHAVSGKNHLLPLLHFHFHTHTKTITPKRTLRFRLAKHCDLAPLQGLREALIAASRAA